MDAVLTIVSDTIGRFSCRSELFSDVAEDIVNSLLPSSQAKVVSETAQAQRHGAPRPILQKVNNRFAVAALLLQAKQARGMMQHVVDQVNGLDGIAMLLS